MTYNLTVPDNPAMLTAMSHMEKSGRNFAADSMNLDVLDKLLGYATVLFDTSIRDVRTFYRYLQRSNTYNGVGIMEMEVDWIDPVKLLRDLPETIFWLGQIEPEKTQTQPYSYLVQCMLITWANLFGHQFSTTDVINWITGRGGVMKIVNDTSAIDHLSKFDAVGSIFLKQQFANPKDRIPFVHID